MTELTKDRLGQPVAMLAVESGGVTGEVSAVFTGKDHAYVTAGDETARLSYKDKPWSVWLHSYEAHGWSEDPGDKNTRAKVYDVKLAEAPPTYRAAILAAVTATVARFTKDNPRVALEAEVTRLERDAERATDQMITAQVTYHAAVVANSAARTLLQEARDRLGELADYSRPDPLVQAAREGQALNEPIEVTEE